MITKSISETKMKRILFFFAIIMLLMILSFIIYIFLEKKILLFLLLLFHLCFIFAFFLLLKIHKRSEEQLKVLFFLKRKIEENRSHLIEFFKKIETIYAKSYSEENNYELSDLIDKLSNNLKEINSIHSGIIEDFEEIDEKINTYILDSLTLIETLVEKLKTLNENVQNEKKEFFNNFIYKIFFSLEIARDWKEYFEKAFDLSLKATLSKLDLIKKINEGDFEFINEIINNFLEQQKSGELYLIKHKEGLDNFFRKIELIKDKFLGGLNKYFEEFNKIHIVTKNVEEISESIRMIALNLSIEASKTQNKAFNVIAKELQNLSLETQNFIKQIVKEVEDSIIKIEQTKDENIKEIEELGELLNISKALTLEYDNNIQQMEKTLNSFVDKVKESNEKNKKLIFDLFKSFQEINISKEEVDHKDFFLSKSIDKILDSFKGLLEEEFGRINDNSKFFNERKYLLNEIKSFISTRQERELLKELYKKYLGIEWDEEIDIVPNKAESELTGNKDDVIIF